jgi:hypothetical protein
MKTLARHVAAGLEERTYCAVFENDLERCWPSSRMAQAERTREIEEFAES